MKPPRATNEAERLTALREYRVIDTDTEQAYKDITTLAAQVCGVPMAVIALLENSRHWGKANVGLNLHEMPSDLAFCAHTVAQSEPLIVRDALKDPRFAGTDIVKKGPRIRFFAGFPLTTKQGLSLGTLCAIDRRPRTLTPEKKRVMEALARQVLALLELRRVSAHLAESLKHVKTLRGLLPICAWCKRIRDDRGYWSQVEAYVHTHTGADFTHGICPDCMDNMCKNGTPRPSTRASAPASNSSSRLR